MYLCLLRWHEISLNWMLWLLSISYFDFVTLIKVMFLWGSQLSVYGLCEFSGAWLLGSRGFNYMLRNISLSFANLKSVLSHILMIATIWRMMMLCNVRSLRFFSVRCDQVVSWLLLFWDVFLDIVVFFFNISIRFNCFVLDTILWVKFNFWLDINFGWLNWLFRVKSI